MLQLSADVFFVAPFSKPHKMNRLSGKKHSAFTLPEILVAVSIFTVVSTVTATLYVRSFRESRRAAIQNQVYDDARFILARVADEVRNGTVDYDEYFNQNVVIPQVKAGVNIVNNGLQKHGLQNYGQNYGRYYSNFFNPGSDTELGFDCNDASGRNKKTCTPLRRTIDRNTGENPFTGKYSEGQNVSSIGEDAFCGIVQYTLDQNLPALFGICTNGAPDRVQEKTQTELYLISSDGTQKTILAREKVGTGSFTLSLLKMNGVDTDNDGISDRFVCSPEFQCRGGDAMDVTPDAVAALNNTAIDSDCFGGDMKAAHVTDLPQFDANVAQPYATDLTDAAVGCDSLANGFSKDFVPISPLRVNVKDIKFIVTPSENPYYAFSEFGDDPSLSQPRVTIILTIEPSLDYTTTSDTFPPLTLIETVSAGSLTPVAAPLLVE